MFEEELGRIQKETQKIVKDSGADPKGAVEKLKALEREAAALMTETSPAYYQAASVLQEAAGDVWIRAGKMPEAEQAFKEMTKLSVRLYQCDKNSYDYRLGYTYFKVASFYSMVIGCNRLNPKVRELDEQQKKIFALAEKFYQDAIGCTMENAKKGMVGYARLHADCLNGLMVLSSAVGDYKKAVTYGKDGVRLDKVLYEKMDDKAYCFRLATHMNALVGVYTFMKETRAAMELLEDCIFALEEHAEEDPVAFGVLLARNYISLGGCYSFLEEEKEHAEEAYKKGLDKIMELNEKTENRLIDDVITSCMMVGDYYTRAGKETKAKVYYTWAMKRASEMSKKTKNPMYADMIRRIQPRI